MNLRPATLADLELLQYWDEQPHVIASDPNDDWDWEVELERTPDWREQLIAEINRRPIGFIQIIDPAREDSHYWGDVAENLRAIDLWIGEASDLGKGHGTKMMHLAITRCFSNPTVGAILVDPLASNGRAHRFYERLGFQFEEFRQFGADECRVYRLTRESWLKIGYLTPLPLSTSKLLHITDIETWEEAHRQGSYRPPSLDREGFIHCFYPDQLLSVANSRFQGYERLVVLAIDPKKVMAEIRNDLVPEIGYFPHLYGPLNVDAVVRVIPFEADASGLFHWSDVLGQICSERESERESEQEDESELV